MAYKPNESDFASTYESKVRRAVSTDYARRQANRKACSKVERNPYEGMSYEALCKRYNIIQGQLLIGKIKAKDQERLRDERKAIAFLLAKEGAGRRSDYQEAWR